MVHRMYRPIAALLLAAIISCAFTSETRACCNQAIIDNISNCNPIVHWTSATGGARDQVLVTGSNLFPFGMCHNPGFYFNDACGVKRNFPLVDGAFIDVNMGGGCCIRVLAIGVPDVCTWKITTVACPPC